jgi:hypothetical protein
MQYASVYVVVQWECVIVTESEEVNVYQSIYKMTYIVTRTSIRQNTPQVL